MEKLWIFLFGYFLGNISLLVSGCTLPTDLTGAWDSSAKGTLNFNSTSMSNYQVYDRGNLAFDCIINSGSNYIFRSETFTFFSSQAQAVICMKLENIKTSMYRYTLYTTELQHADYERVKYVSTGATVTEADACDDTSNTETSLLIEDGALTSVKVQCPDTFLGKFSYSLDDNTDCINKTGSLDVCTTDLYTMTFNYSACSTIQAYSSGGVLNCIYSTTSGTATQLYVYNQDNTTDESTTYRFTCYILETSGNYIYATQYPQDCPSTQNSTYVASPGISLEMLASVPSTTTSETQTAAASLGIVAAAAGIGLILILVGILVSVFIYKKKKRQVDPRMADKGLPPTDTGMVGCLEEVDVHDEVNAVLISGSGKSKTEKKPPPNPVVIARQISLLDSLKSKIFKNNSVHSIDINITDDDKEVLNDNDLKKIFKPQIPCFEIVETENEPKNKPNVNHHIQPSTSRPYSSRLGSRQNNRIDPPPSPSPPPAHSLIEEIDNFNDAPIDLNANAISDSHSNSHNMGESLTMCSRLKSPEDLSLVPNIDSYEADAFKDDDSKIASKPLFSNLSTPVENASTKVTLKKVENVLDFLRQNLVEVVDVGEDNSDDNQDDMFAMAATWQEDFDMAPMPKVKKKYRRKKNISNTSKKNLNALTSEEETSNGKKENGKLSDVVIVPSSLANDYDSVDYASNTGKGRMKYARTESHNKVNKNVLYCQDEFTTKTEEAMIGYTDKTGMKYNGFNKPPVYADDVFPSTSSAHQETSNSVAHAKNIVYGESNNFGSFSNRFDCQIHPTDDDKCQDTEVGNITIKSLDSLDPFGGAKSNNSLTPRNDINFDEYSGTVIHDEGQNSVFMTNTSREVHAILKNKEESILGFDSSKYENDDL